MLLKARPYPAHDAAQATSDHLVVAALLEGDEAVFVALVKRHHRVMVQLARAHVGCEASAEEIVQDCWLLILRQLPRWSGRGSFRGWMYAIVANQARSRLRRESRMVPFSALEFPDSERGWEPLPLDKPCSAGGWSGDSLERQEVLETIRIAIEELPARQRAVITLRDVAGCDGKEACTALRLSEANQRVLLHRARMKVRGAVDRYLRG